MQNIHAAAAERYSHMQSPPSFVPVRATGDGDFHASLRRIDASGIASRHGDTRLGDRRKCIVLDFSTTEALTTILRQVNQLASFVSLSSFGSFISRYAKQQRIRYKNTNDSLWLSITY